MLPRLHLVTDDAVLADAGFGDTAERVLQRCGADAVLQLRGHATTAYALHDAGERLAGACLRSGAWLLVNDRVDIAMAVRANGVQLGARSLPVGEARALLGAGARIGYSAHGPPEAARAAADGADFVLLGSIWESASHPGAATLGVSGLRDCCADAGVPVVAIGGVTPARVADAAAAGAHGVAVLSGVWHAADPVAAAVEYVEAARAAWRSGSVMT